MIDNPILRRELIPAFLRKTTFSPMRVSIISAYFGLNLLMTIHLYFNWVSGAYYSIGFSHSARTLIPLFVLPALTPALLAGSIAGERERRNWDAIILSRMTPLEIIWGKLAPRLVLLGLIALPWMLICAVSIWKCISVTEVRADWNWWMSPQELSEQVIVPWIIGLLLAFGNAVLTIYLSLRCTSTRTALLISYGITTAIFILFTQIGKATLFEYELGYELMYFFDSNGNILGLKFASIPWGIVMPCILLLIMIRRFYRLNARVQG